MPNPVWPAGLPQRPLVDGYEEAAPELALRTQMDAGPSKMRRRFTAGFKPITAQTKLTATQVTTLEDFYKDTLQGGTLKFDWQNPRTGATVEFRFRGAPKYKPLGGLTWMAQLALEIMP